MPKLLRTFITWSARFSRRTVWAVGCLVLGLAAGLASAVYALGNIGLIEARTQNGWSEWNLSEKSLTLPYALGHFLALGQVPPTRTGRQFIRKTDDAGKLLSSSCVAVLSGVVPAARWWTLAATAPDGTIQPERGVLAAGQAVLEANGRLVATVSDEPSPGNWLVPARSTYMLVLTLHDTGEAGGTFDLPAVTQADC